MYDKKGFLNASGCGGIVSMKPLVNDKGNYGVNLKIVVERVHNNQEYKHYFTVNVYGADRANYILQTYNLGDQAIFSGSQMQSSYQDRNDPSKRVYYEYIQADVFQVVNKTAATQQVFAERKAQRENNNQPVPAAAQQQAQQPAAAQQQAQQPAAAQQAPQMQPQEPAAQDFDDDIPF